MNTLLIIPVTSFFTLIHSIYDIQPSITLSHSGHTPVTRFFTLFRSIYNFLTPNLLSVYYTQDRDFQYRLTFKTHLRCFEVFSSKFLESPYT